MLAQVFLGELLMRLDRHAAMAPQMKAERADPADDRHHSTKKKPNRDGHVLGGFAVLGAVAKRARHRLLCSKHNGHHQQRGDSFHWMIRRRFIFLYNQTPSTTSTIAN